MKKLLLVLLLIPTALLAANVEEDYDWGGALQENPESEEYQAIVGTLAWRLSEVDKEIKANCEDRTCVLATFRETVKGWTASVTVGNGSGSGYAYGEGSGGAINIFNGDRPDQSAVANITIGYRNLVCNREALVPESQMRAHSTLMADLVTEENKIKEELTPAEIVILKVYSSVLKAMGQSGGGCSNNNGYR
jgi:hypothetical protein